MKKILVPTDFSATAEKALRFALDIATKAKGAVILYHVYTAVESPFIDTEEKRMQYNQEKENSLLLQMEALKKKVMNEHTLVPVASIVGRSPLIKSILDTVTNNEVGLIVMGTQGASGFKKAVIGSIAARVMEKSPVPVLLVPEKFEWKEPEQIVFTSNFEKGDKEAIALALAYANIYNAAVTVAHVYNVYALEEEKEETKFQTYAFNLQRTFQEHKLSFELIESTSIIETMEQLEQQLPFDMLVMVRRKKGFLEKFFIDSFTRNMACVSNKALLIVPASK